MTWRRGLQWIWQTTVYTCLALLGLLVLAWLTLQWGILPHIQDWRPMIERHASQAVGVPVRIGSITLRSSNWVPELELRDVVLRDPSGGEALRLPRVSAALSPRSLLAFEPRLAQLYIEDARLLVRRDVAGHLHVGGLDVAERSTVASTDENAALDWLFSQQELALRHGTLRWVDEQRGAPALELSDVDIVVRNGLRSHDMRLDATPPAPWGDRFSLRARSRQPLFARAGDWRRWAGTIYADLPRGDVEQLKRHVDLPFELDRGNGSLRLWLDFRDQDWRALSVDVRLNQVGLRLASDVEPLAIAHVQGRLSARRDVAGVTLQAADFGFETSDGLVWPAGDMSLSWRQAQPGVAASPVTGGRLAADHLDLGLMRRLAAALPLPPLARQSLADYQPEGRVTDLRAEWSGNAQAPSAFRVNAAISHSSMAAGVAPPGKRLGRPGWRNADVRLSASQTGGTAEISMDGGSIDLPGVFEEPVVPFTHLGATVAWTVERAAQASEPAPLAVTVRDLHFVNADAEGDLQLQWHTGTGPTSAAGAGTTPASAAASGAFGRGQRFPGDLNLQGVLTKARAGRVARYLPLVLQDTRHFVAAAVTSGELTGVNFRVRGDLADFPYQRQHDGEFHIEGHVAGAGLDYVPGPRASDGSRAPSRWPAFSQVQGTLVIDRGTLAIHDARARQGELTVQGVEGGIAAPGPDGLVLALKGHVNGPATDFLRYVAESPVAGWLHNGLAKAAVTGAADLDLALSIPLRDVAAAQVRGAFVLTDNDVRMLPGAPELAGAHARFDFTEHGMTLTGGGARLLGGDATFDGGTRPDGTLHLAAQGTVSAVGLQRIADEPTAARLAGHLAGQTPYKLEIDILKGQTEFSLSSPLTGLAFALPAPLDKPADAAWPLRVSATVTFDAQGRPRDTLRARLAPPQGPELQAQIVRDLSGPVPRPELMAYSIGAPLPTPIRGGLLALSSATLDGDAWAAFARTLAAPAPPGPATPPAAPANDKAGAGVSYVPAAAAIQVRDLLLGGRHLANADIQVAEVQAAGESVWRANVRSDQSTGLIEYRPDTPARGAELFARLDRLVLDSRDDPSAAPAQAQAPAAPDPDSTVPALDIVADSFELNGKQLGKLQVAATLQSGGRNWRLTKLSLSNPDATFTGSGRWSGAPARRMSLDFTLSLADSGALLERLGMGRVIKHGKGALSGAVTWTGSPLALDYPSLQGKLKLALDAGQFLKADAGAGRLLGVLSLQSLPRRLTLDFRDVFQAGFAFDNVTGDVDIASGVASTRDFRMRGLNAAVLMSGRADLKAETQDLDVIIVPEVNAGAASLAYAAINPIVGIGTFLAQLFLKSPLTEAGTRELHITGTWAQPHVDQVEHKAAVAAAAEAASQARAAESAVEAASEAATRTAP